MRHTVGGAQSVVTPLRHERVEQARALKRGWLR